MPEPACLHFVAGWPEPGGMVEAALAGLEGNRELAIRNLRRAEVARATLDAQRPQLEAAVRQFAHVVEASDGGAGAVFADPHERDAVARAFAQLILGPDPFVTRVAAR